MRAQEAKIVVLDDEKAIAELIKAILRSKGYPVSVAHCCDEAARIIRDSAGRESILLVTDVVMPDMSGPEFVASLRTQGFAIPVLYISGYVDMDNNTNAAELREGLLLTKPFGASELLEAVAQAFLRAGAA